MRSPFELLLPSHLLERCAAEAVHDARSAERSDCVRLMLQVCDRLVDVCSDVLDAVGDGWALVCLP